jgi:UDP-N-acetylglucosamine 2-epimerase (non-hydrolysing)
MSPNHSEDGRAVVPPASRAARLALGPLLCVVGARPNYMKMAPLIRAVEAGDGAPSVVLVHTGQHYDPALKDRLFEDLGMRMPDEQLDVRSGSHAVQTAEVMSQFEPLLERHQPSAVVVVGDVNSSLAAGLVTVKAGVPLVHVEAGLRSFDRRMPEEINRVLIDQMSDFLYTTERGASENLRREGIDGERVQFVGNLMIDSLLDAVPRSISPRATLLESMVDPAMVKDEPFALVTLHRPSNVDDPVTLSILVETVRAVADRMPVIWPMHPRTRARLEQFAFLHRLMHPRIAQLSPLTYLQMVGMMSEAFVVLTDSGGVQEETTALRVPCLTLRENTERPITVTQGTNQLLTADRRAVLAAIDSLIEGSPIHHPLPEGWDGQSARRLVSNLLDALARRGGQRRLSGEPAPG